MAVSQSQLQQNTQALQQSQIAFQNNTQASLKNLETQVSQLARELSEIRTQGSGKLPSQTIVNPRENVSAITLRSGKQVEEVFHKAEKPSLPPIIKPVITSPTFPSHLDRTNNDDQDKEVLETFRKVQVNIPLLDAIRQVPKYAKFLKDLCTKKRKMKGNEVLSVGESCSAILQRKIPPKLKDPGSFIIPCSIGKTRFCKAMLDLGSSINVMPSSMYFSLNLGLLKQTGIVIQLADGSNAYPRGVLEDVLVQVNGLIFPADFYVLDMDGECSPKKLPLLLGRPFMKTARTKIDVYNGTLTMEFDGEIASFKVLDEKGDSPDFRSCNAINVFDSLLQRDSKGPYKEKQMENESFLRNATPWKDEMIKGKKKKTKVWRPLAKQVANYMYWLRHPPP